MKIIIMLVSLLATVGEGRRLYEGYRTRSLSSRRVTRGQRSQYSGTPDQIEGIEGVLSGPYAPKWGRTGLYSSDQLRLLKKK